MALSTTMKMLSRLVSLVMLSSFTVGQPRALGEYVQFNAKFDNPYIHSEATISPDKTRWYHAVKDLGEKTGALPSREFSFPPFPGKKPSPAPAPKPVPVSKSSKKGGKKGKGTCDSKSGKKGGKKGRSCQPSKPVPKPVPQKPTPKPVPTKPTPQPSSAQPSRSDGETSSPTRQPIGAGLEPTSQPSRYIPTGPSQDMPSSQPSVERGSKRPTSTPLTRRPSAALPTSPPTTTSPPSLDSSPAPSTSIAEDASGKVSLAPFAVLHTLRGRGDPPTRIEYLAATSVTEDFLAGFFMEIFSETNRINLRKFDLTFNGGTYTSGQPIRIDYKAEAKFDPLARVPKSRELDELLIAAFQGELMKALVDALNEKLPASNVFSTTESLEHVEGRGSASSMSATSLAFIVAAGAIFTGGILFYFSRKTSKKGGFAYDKAPPPDDSTTSDEMTTELSSQDSVGTPRQFEYLSPIVEVVEEGEEQESADNSSLAYSDDSRQSRSDYDTLKQEPPFAEEIDLESIQL